MIDPLKLHSERVECINAGVASRGIIVKNNLEKGGEERDNPSNAHTTSSRRSSGGIRSSLRGPIARDTARGDIAIETSGRRNHPRTRYVEYMTGTRVPENSRHAAVRRRVWRGHGRHAP